MAALPERIFKYVSSERIDILEKLLIRFTQPSCFNDPFEMRVSVEGHSPESLDRAEDEVYKNQFVKYVLRGGEHSSKKFRKIQKSHNRTAMRKLKFDSHFQKQAATDYAFKKWDSQIGILSLSAAEKNLLMWAHYADSHRGMLIEFNPKHIFFNGPNPSDAEFNFGMLTKVIYSKDRPKDRVGVTSVLEIIPMLKIKSEEWIKEQEWRVYEMLDRRAEQVAKGSETVHLFKLPPDCIKRVVVGYNMGYKGRKRVADAVKTNPKLKDVRIDESFLCLDSFSLEYQPLARLY